MNLLRSTPQGHGTVAISVKAREIGEPSKKFRYGNGGCRRLARYVSEVDGAATAARNRLRELE